MIALIFGPEYIDLRYMDLNVIKQTRDFLFMTPVKKQNISQINVSVNICTYMASLAIHSHVELFIFFPLHTFNEMIYKLNTYL